MNAAGPLTPSHALFIPYRLQLRLKWGAEAQLGYDREGHIHTLLTPCAHPVHILIIPYSHPIHTTFTPGSHPSQTLLPCSHHTAPLLTPDCSPAHTVGSNGRPQLSATTGTGRCAGGRCRPGCSRTSEMRGPSLSGQRRRGSTSRRAAGTGKGARRASRSAAVW